MNAKKVMDLVFCIISRHVLGMAKGLQRLFALFRSCGFGDFHIDSAKRAVRVGFKHT